MILGFSTQLNGKPTYFVEKIHKGFRLMELIMKAGIDPSTHYPPNYNYVAKDKLAHKIHTIREDKKERWKPGTKIDFFINCRQKDMFRFAPVLPVVSVQEIFMTRRGTFIEISIAKIDSYIGEDDFQLNGLQIEQLALNDGFDEYNDFRIYFLEVIEKNGKATGNYWFKGKIIHWTDLKY
ncbi:hypothetical protein [Flavobacterium sp. LB2P74]|uniref:hypothetical protein n=1 Tax=Flavobacterium sp. LB2P74 TaxID=3401717 RepID=UPI003AB01597